MTNRSLCPRTEPFLLGGQEFTAEEVLAVLSPHLTAARKGRIREIVANRTYSVVPVIEGLYDFGNVNAVLRSAEALGYQAAHVIELLARFKKANRVSQGAEKWLDIERWETTAACVAHLRQLGYRIVATHAESGGPIEDMAFDMPTAVFFGNEHEGITPELAETADACIRLPMLGFTQSYNISVAAAITLYHIYRDRVTRLGKHSDLSAAEMVRLEAVYYRRSLDAADKILLQSRQQR